MILSNILSINILSMNNKKNSNIMHMMSEDYLQYIAKNAKNLTKHSKLLKHKNLEYAIDAYKVLIKKYDHLNYHNFA